MRYKALFFITGTSKGLGRSLAEALLKDTNNYVYGISRNNSLASDRFKFIQLDLSDISAVKKFQFPEEIQADKVVLVNNAGVLGRVKHIGDADDSSMQEVINTNLLAPMILSNHFIRSYRDTDSLVINISSGAGKNAIDGWSSYCTSKAGLDMFSRVVDAEQKIIGSKVKVFSIAPGIVDTEMQHQIRQSDHHDFSRVETFREYYEKGELKQAEEVAIKIIRVIDSPENFSEVVFSVKDS